MLNIQQAIDDLEYFAKNVNLPMPGGDSVTPDKAPWILVGGSYAGKQFILPPRYDICSYLNSDSKVLLLAGRWSSEVVFLNSRLLEMLISI